MCERQKGSIHFYIWQHLHAVIFNLLCCDYITNSCTVNLIHIHHPIESYLTGTDEKESNSELREYIDLDHSKTDIEQAHWYSLGHTTFMFACIYIYNFRALCGMYSIGYQLRSPFWRMRCSGLPHLLCIHNVYVQTSASFCVCSAAPLSVKLNPCRSYNCHGLGNISASLCRCRQVNQQQTKQDIYITTSSSFY